MKWIFFISAAPLIAALAVLVANRIPPEPALPQPNGYDDILRAGRLVTETTNDYRRIPEAELRQLVITNVQALKELRIGLSRECRVPVESSNSYVGRHLSELPLIKRLATALAAEARLAELEGRTNDAARSYMDAIRLGNESARGGLLIDGLLGLACESIGVSGLATNVSTLDADQCRELSRELERINARRETAEQILHNERRWRRRTYSLIVRLGTIQSWTLLKNANTNYVARQATQVGRQSQLVIDLATRAYELEKGRAPTNLH